ncbi:MAG: arylsulfatase [Akkermansiaceae bacterium]|nr:arylsulfatase [Akkermansiaceae bacterium]
MLKPPLSILLLLLQSSCSLFAAQSSSPPNIVLILADDLGYADTGFNNSLTAKTPHLDRFVKSGVNLTDFRACPMCSPTRAGTLTGRWPLRFGMMRAVIPPWSKYGLPEKENTLPEFLAQAGYDRRGIIGKWHLGHSKKSYLPTAHGFTHFVGHYNGAIDYFTHEREEQLDWHQNEKPLREKGYATDLLANHAVHFINESPSEKPYFLYLPFNAPHSPFQATKSDLAPYSSIKDKKRRTYAAMVTSMDRAIGKVLNAVESRPDADNTLIIFYSDNGGIPSAGSNAPYRGAKLNLYEGGTRVAAALRWPAQKLTGGKTFAGRIGYIDILPTILKAAEVSLPENIDGLNFLPALKKNTPLPERPWFSYMHQSKNASSSLHLGPWKLIVSGDAFNSNTLTLELYNLENDLRETTNLAVKHPARAARMLAQIKKFGTLQVPGATLYKEGRKDFTAPKDWLIK